MKYAANMCNLKKNFPSLVFDKNPRIREYNYYKEEQKAAVVYHYIVNGLSFRVLDKSILHVDFDSRGWQSMAICHYLGLRDIHKGFFKGMLVSEILEVLFYLSIDSDYHIIFYYIDLYLNSIQSLTDSDKQIVALYEKINPKQEVLEKDWICKTLLANVQNNQIDKSLLSLPTAVGEQGKEYVVNNVRCFVRNSTLRESIKSLYNYRCQICDDVILKTGWNRALDRRHEWRYLSADVHHIIPLSRSGADDRSNILCLCPSCHRKFHSGEFRLKKNNSGIFLKDELLGNNKNIVLKHFIEIE